MSGNTPHGDNINNCPIRHFILLIDGTDVSASHKKNELERFSNIYKLSLYFPTHNDNDESQIILYSPGIGSETDGSYQSDKIFAASLPLHVEKAYISLCMNYNEGDNIYIFGFSRGAVVARLVAALIGRYGLLRPSQIEMFPKIWEYYKSNFSGVDGIISESEIDKFKTDYCWSNSHGYLIKFMGLFDTVSGAYDGFLDPQLQDIYFKNRDLGGHIETTIHLLAAHERRGSFKPVLFERKKDSRQTLEQIWIPGVHTDIGGGYQDSFLSKISLLSMLERVTDRTPLKIDNGRKLVLQVSIETDLGEDRFIINDELAKLDKLSDELGAEIDRFLFHPSESRVSNPKDECQFKHPVFKILQTRICHNKQDNTSEPFTTPDFLGDLKEAKFEWFEHMRQRVV